MESWIKDANNETFLCVQIETREALANVESMAAVPGLDVMFFGPGDMGWRLSDAGGNVAGADHFFDGKNPEAIDKVAAAGKAAGTAWGMPVGTKEQVSCCFWRCWCCPCMC